MQRATHSRLSTLAVSTIILSLGFALRAFEVGRQALRGDEAFTLNFVLQPFEAMIRGMAQIEPNPPGYYLLLRLWLALAGSGELALRWPSVLAGVLAVAASYRLGRALGGAWVGLATMVLVGLSPFLIWYAQDARDYSVLTSLVILAMWLTWEAAHRRGWRRWLAAGGLWWLALFTHYLAALPFALAGLALIAAPATRRAWPSAAVTGLAVGLTYLPWALYAAPLLAAQNKNWIQPLPSLAALWRTLVAASSGPASAGATPGLQIAGGVLVAALGGLGAVAAFRRRRPPPSGCWPRASAHRWRCGSPPWPGRSSPSNTSSPACPPSYAWSPGAFTRCQLGCPPRLCASPAWRCGRS